MPCRFAGRNSRENKKSHIFLPVLYRFETWVVISTEEGVWEQAADDSVCI